MKTGHGWLLAAACFLGMMNCRTGLADSEPTIPSAPESFSAEPGGLSELSLKEAYLRALARSEAIAIKKEEIAKTRAQWLKATGEAVGDMDFVLTDALQATQDSGSSSGGSVGSSLTAEEKRERKWTFTQPLFQGFKSLGALGGAGSLTRQRRHEKRRSEELLFLDTVSAFYGLLSQRRDVETIESTLRLFEERIAFLHEREGIGRARPSEVVTARARMRRLQGELAHARGGRAAAEHLLEFYTGLPLDRTSLADPSEGQTLAGAPDQYLRDIASRSDVEAAAAAQKTAKQAVVVSQSDFWPQITLESNHYEKREGFQSGIDWDLLFKISMPLYKGGESLGAFKEAVSNWKMAKLSYELAKREADLEVKQAYSAWQASWDELQALQLALQDSEENYRLQKEEYDRSLVNNLEVLEALEELLNTRRDTNRAQYELKENYWRLETAAGKCCESL